VIDAVAVTKGVALSATVIVDGWWLGSNSTTPLKVCTPASAGTKV